MTKEEDSRSQQMTVGVEFKFVKIISGNFHVRQGNLPKCEFLLWILLSRVVRKCLGS